MPQHQGTEEAWQVSVQGVNSAMSRESHVGTSQWSLHHRAWGMESQAHFYSVLNTVSWTGKFLPLQFLPIPFVKVCHSSNVSPDLNAALMIVKAACYVQYVKMTLLGLSGSCPVTKPNSLLKNQKYSHKTRFSHGPGCSFHMGRSVKRSFYGRAPRFL